jgi:hypothetical protein
MTMSYHVRDVLESVQDSPPAARTTTDDIIGRARGIRLRRLAAAVTGSTAAVVAVLVAASTLLGGPATRPAQPYPVGAAVGTQFTMPDGFGTVFGEYRAGKYRIGPVGQVTATYQELPVYLDGQTWTDDDSGQEYPLVDGMITFYRTGVYNPDSLGAADPSDAYGPKIAVTVAGQPGFARESTPQVYASGGVRIGQSLAPQDVYKRTVLEWQYGPDAWATYIPGRARALSTAEAVSIASAVTVQPARQLRIPYTLGFLPKGWQLVSVTQTPAKISSEISEVWLRNGPVPKADGAQRIDLGMPGVRILVMKGQPKDAAIQGRDGVHCYPGAKGCEIIKGDYLIDVSGRDLDGRSSGITDAQLQQLAHGLKVGDLIDQSTWKTPTA